MKTDIGHLPQTKQRELEKVVRIIHEEFAGIVERSKSDAKKDERIYKIILFGSYARGTWVDEPHTLSVYRRANGIGLPTSELLLQGTLEAGTES